jgi:predicted transcriptional regulator
MSETLSERLQVLLTPSERQALDRLASKEQRSLSFVARRAIQAAIKKGRAA